ncbi:MAG: saccharopine dehydrogenase [Flavobacteriaceae bacterium]|nr:saccharopine dehydrogenase [Flavobacteriaceae bacterium]
MKKILVLGAGLSSPWLIRYLLEKDKWQVTVADTNLALAQSRVKGFKKGRAIEIDINNKEQRQSEIYRADVVVSLLPASLHIKVAQDCVDYSKHLVTASYISPEMEKLDAKARKNGVLLLNECGLDPGLDHISAMQMLDKLRASGAEITGFRSYCGGLIASEHDDNPWHYKFTWNPKNVILAGQATAKFKQKGQVRHVPPQRIFTEIEQLKLGKNERFDTYLNRDSLAYVKPYGLEKAETVLRGTLRGSGFCDAWHILVLLGYTDDSYTIDTTQIRTLKELTDSFLSQHNKSIQDFVWNFTNHPDDKEEELFKMLKWLELEKEIPLPSNLEYPSPANVLLWHLQNKWKLGEKDVDRIVMHHSIDYSLGRKSRHLKSTLVVKGESKGFTAMAKTVGLPLGIATRLILEGKIKDRGVQLPISKTLYEPMMAELAEHGIRFEEESK